ncbi:MAG: hypothetical protein KAR33_07895 [Candidatus Thorarchaeota archaeon]|nr:hypothetical protein [Candidatus Thorarchaeota archaeon]
MSKYDIAVATIKPKTFYIVVKILEELDLQFRVCSPGDRFCDVAKVVITTESEALSMDLERLVLVEEVPDEITVSFDVMTRYLSVRNPREIVVGIDPGLHIGLVVLANGTTIFSKVMASTVDASQTALELVQLAKKRYPKSRTLVRIGLGSKLYSTLFLRSLVRKMPDIDIELVDERHTTSPGGYLTDQTSALLIAARTGRRPEKVDFQIESKRGFIRALQHLFTWLTNNRGELSLETAREILADETTVSEVLLKFTQLEKNRSTA